MTFLTPGAHSAPRKALAAMVIVAVSVYLIPSSAFAAKDPRQQRREVRAKRSKVVSQVNALKASGKQVNDALDALQQNLSEAQADYSSARSEAAAAEASAATAKEQEARKERELALMRQSLNDVALKSYVDSGTAGFDLFSSDSTNVMLSTGYNQAVGETLNDVIDQMRQRGEDLTSLRQSAQQYEALARQRRADEKSQLIEVQQAEAQQQALSDQVENRLEQSLAEAAALADIDQSLSQQISKQDADLARRLARARGRGGSSGPVSRGPVVPRDETTMAGGVRVHVSIADRISRMISAASNDGISLVGSGWRDSSTQVALRRSNCGGSDYAIWSMPASRCRPPTARPGASMHERGLAIDFACGGALITSRSNACYRWLANNAANYGMYNLPSEPWHWSTNAN